MARVFILILLAVIDAGLPATSQVFVCMLYMIDRDSLALHLHQARKLLRARTEELELFSSSTPEEAKRYVLWEIRFEIQGCISEIKRLRREIAHLEETNDFESAIYCACYEMLNSDVEDLAHLQEHWRSMRQHDGAILRDEFINFLTERISHSKRQCLALEQILDANIRPKDEDVFDRKHDTNDTSNPWANFGAENCA